MSTVKLFAQALRIIDFVVIIAIRCHFCLIAPSSCLLKIIPVSRGLNLIITISTVVFSEASRFLTANG